MSGPSDALVATNQQSNPNFAQQGSVDWVSLSQSTLGFSVEILSRFSKAGVEMITVAIGQAIFSTFVVPSEGQKRIADAVGKLKVFSSYGNVLWFGFGIKHVVRTLCETEQGATCAAICACLSVSYDPLLACQVLKALTDEYMTPGTLTPALSQWGSLLRVCAGAVGDSQFPMLVEGFSRLVVGTSSGCTRRPLHAATTAKSLAGALKELSKVSNGTLRSVTFEGGVDCGWLAAVAQWLLCLRIEIFDDSGSCLYSNTTSDNSYAQVTIYQHSAVVKKSPGAKIIKRSYFVPPGSLWFNFLDKDRMKGLPLTHIFSCGRSEWDHILGDTFGGALDILVCPENARKLAEFFCSGFQPGHGSDQLEMASLNSLGDATIDEYPSRRRAFLKFAACRLPELGTVLQVAERDQGQIYTTSFTTGRFVKALAEICNCSRCSTGSETGKTMFCLPKVGAIIYEFLWILSWLDIDSSVKPSSTGLLTLYYSTSRQVEDPIMMRNFHWLPMRATLMTLFTGSDYGEGIAADVSAISDSGICIYYTCLRDPNVGPSQLLRYRVVLGHIERNGCTYQKISDPKQRDRILPDEDALSYSISMFGPTTNFSLVVEETLDAGVMEASFQINTQSVMPQQSGDFIHNCSLRHMANHQTSLSGAYVGVAQLRQQVVKSIHIGQCSGNRISISISTGPTLRTPWAGECSTAQSAVWTGEGESELVPRQGEWLLSQQVSSMDPESCCIMLLRGSYAILYSILCHTSSSSSVRLTFIGPCLICTIHPYLNASEQSFEWATNLTLPVTVYSMFDAIPLVSELASSMAWDPDLENSSTVTTENAPDSPNGDET
jgi:hypothetical protein